MSGRLSTGAGLTAKYQELTQRWNKLPKAKG